MSMGSEEPSHVATVGRTPFSRRNKLRMTKAVPMDLPFMDSDSEYYGLQYKPPGYSCNMRSHRTYSDDEEEEDKDVDSEESSGNHDLEEELEVMEQNDVQAAKDGRYEGGTGRYSQTLSIIIPESHIPPDYCETRGRFANRLTKYCRNDDLAEEGSEFDTVSTYSEMAVDESSGAHIGGCVRMNSQGNYEIDDDDRSVASSWDDNECHFIAGCNVDDAASYSDQSVFVDSGRGSLKTNHESKENSLDTDSGHSSSKPATVPVLNSADLCQRYLASTKDSSHQYGSKMTSVTLTDGSSITQVLSVPQNRSMVNTTSDVKDDRKINSDSDSQNSSKPAPRKPERTVNGIKFFGTRKFKNFSNAIPPDKANGIVLDVGPNVMYDPSKEASGGPSIATCYHNNAHHNGAPAASTSTSLRKPLPVTPPPVCHGESGAFGQGLPDICTSAGAMSYSPVDEDEDGDSGDYSDSDYSWFEPPWAGAVGKQGDVFFVESDSTPDVPNLTDPPHTKPTQNGTAHHGRASKKSHKKKSHSSKKSKISIEQNNNDKNIRQRGNVTFNDHPSGVLKDVKLHVVPGRHNLGRRASLSEALLGIVTGEFSGKMGLTNGMTADRRIMVQGLIPGGEAMRSAEIKIGDWLMCINDLEVTLDNLDNILSAITTPKEVKLTIQKLAVQAIPRPTLVKKNNGVNEELIRLISGDRLSLERPSLDGIPHVALYLTLDSGEGEHDKDGLMYQYPKKRCKLLDIRGLFITLSHMLVDVTDTIGRNSSMIVDGQQVHVGYAKLGREVLVLGVPGDRLSIYELNHVLEDVVRILKILYGSLHSAFSYHDNQGRLDHFFSLVFQRVLLSEELVRSGSRQSDYLEPFMELLSGVRALTLPDETKVTINNCLREFESADFADMSDDFYDMRRAYTILGTSLFYKGYLIANHLPREDLIDLTLYLRYHCLLTLCQEEQMGQVVIWREFFPWRRCHVHAEPLIPGYTEPDARWFVLVVGMKNKMLAMLLEAGGCAAWVEGHPSPDPFLIDQAKATLLQLETLDVPNQCEFRLAGPPIPSLCCVDWFNARSKDENINSQPNTLVKLTVSPKTATNSPSKKLMQPESILKKKNSPRDRPQGRGPIYDVESDADSQSTGTSEGSTPVLDRRGRKQSVGSDESMNSGSTGSFQLFRGHKRQRNMLSAFDLSGLRQDLEQMPGTEDRFGSFVKLPSGCDNTLFQYVQLDTMEGIYVCPSHQELRQVTTSNHAALLRNFHQACITIKSVLDHTAKAQNPPPEDEVGRFGTDTNLEHVVEHGILFQMPMDKWNDAKNPPATYWVVGRYFGQPHPRQFFVCFHNSAQQNLVELAFKLGFGMAV